MNAIFAGSFDPFTLGHLEIVKSGLKIFDRIIVAVAEDTDKKSASLSERVYMAKATLEKFASEQNTNDKKRQNQIPCQTEVRGFTGLTTDFALKNGCNVILRGIRGAGDFEYEKGLLDIYKRLADVEIVYIFSQLPHISSSQVRLLARLNASLSGYVSDIIKSKVIELYGVK